MQLPHSHTTLIKMVEHQPRQYCFSMYTLSFIVLSNIIAFQDIHIPITRPCDYVVLCGKEELRLQRDLHLLISWPWEGEIILDYPGGPSATTGVLISERGRQEIQCQFDTVEVQPLLILKMEEGAKSQGKAGKGKDMNFPLETPEGIQPCRHWF